VLLCLQAISPTYLYHPLPKSECSGEKGQDFVSYVINQSTKRDEIQLHQSFFVLQRRRLNAEEVSELVKRINLN